MIIVDYLNDIWQLAIQGDRQGIFFFAALYTLLLLSYSLIYQLRVRSWPQVKGELLNATLERFGAGHIVKAEQTYAASALYQYVVDGEQYQGSRISSWLILASHNVTFVLKKQLAGIEKYPDGGVKVFFNPKSPKKSFLIKPGLMGVAITIFLALVPAVLYFFEYRLSR
ncbi:MAG: DUF3592 domain-containing protein [Cognaticolwellia sp.]